MGALLSSAAWRFNARAAGTCRSVQYQKVWGAATLEDDSAALPTPTETERAPRD